MTELDRLAVAVAGVGLAVVGAVGWLGALWVWGDIRAVVFWWGVGVWGVGFVAFLVWFIVRGGWVRLWGVLSALCLCAGVGLVVGGFWWGVAIAFLPAGVVLVWGGVRGGFVNTE